MNNNTQENIADPSKISINEIELTSNKIQKLKHSIENIIFGQSNAIDNSLITLLAGGHLLLVGVPGLAKTKLVQVLGIVLGLEEKRVQFTPDLMPSDILGSEIMDESITGKKSFRFIKGPVFSNLLMADEINRASPRTQSALLQAMQEKRVSIAGKYHYLPKPFHVLATQNPIEHEGTYPLPEAQLDRFLMQVDIDYPKPEVERKIIIHTTVNDEETPKKVLTPQDLIEAQKIVRILPAGDSVIDTIIKIVNEGRPETTSINEIKEMVEWGPGPRASQALMLAAKARALLGGRLAPSIDDVLLLTYPVLKHRMSLSLTARANGCHLNKLIQMIVQKIDR